MAYKAELTAEEHDALDESERKFYRQEGDIFRVDVPDVKTEREITGLKSALDTERKTRNTLADQLKKYEGVDVDRHRQLLHEDEVRKAQGDKGPDPAHIKSYLDSDDGKRILEDEHKRRFARREQELNTELEKYRGSNATLSTRLEELEIDGGVEKVLADPDFKFKLRSNAFLEDIKRRARKVFKMVEGKKVPVDEQGHTLFGKDPQVPLTEREWLEDLAAKVPEYFKESVGSGARPGAATGANGGGPISRKKRSEMTLDEKTAFITKHGDEEYLKLPV